MDTVHGGGQEARNALSNATTRKGRKGKGDTRHRIPSLAPPRRPPLVGPDGTRMVTSPSGKFDFLASGVSKDSAWNNEIAIIGILWSAYLMMRNSAEQKRMSLRPSR